MIETYAHPDCCELVFSWDGDKNRTNRGKHKLSFELASLVFHDPTILSDFNRTVAQEDRFQSLGLVGRTLLLVIHSEKVYENVQTIRIISARKATKQERAQYRGRTGR